MVMKFLIAVRRTEPGRSRMAARIAIRMRFFVVTAPIF